MTERNGERGFTDSVSGEWTLYCSTPVDEAANASGLEAEIIAIFNRGNRVDEWPEDESSAYRDNGGFSEGRAAVDRVRARKIIEAVRLGTAAEPEQQAQVVSRAITAGGVS